MGEQMELQEERKMMENKPLPCISRISVHSASVVSRGSSQDHCRNAGRFWPPCLLCRSGQFCFCSPKEGWGLNLSFYLFALVCWFWQRLQILSNEFLLSLAHSVCLKCSEIRLLKTGLACPFNSSRGAQCLWGRDGPGENPSSHSLGLAHLSSQMSCFCFRLLSRRVAVPSCNSTVSLCLVLCTLLLASTSFVLSGWFIFDMFFTSGLGTTFPGSVPILSYRCIWVMGPHICYW